MAIKELPTNMKTYYNMMKERSELKIKELDASKEELNVKLAKQKKVLLEKIDVYKTNFNIHLNSFDEFVDNEYKTGMFYRIVKAKFINSEDNHKLVPELFDLYDYADTLKQLEDINKELELQIKLKNLSFKEYRRILQVYYSEVHRQLVINGHGYTFSGNTGWICVNRIVLKNPKKCIDYKATKEREKELKAQGKRIYNREEAEWCKERGIEYNAEDKRVFLHNEYCYEIPLINPKLKGGYNLKLEITDYRHHTIRGKSNDDLINECNNDINKICDLQIDLKTKVTLCDKVDKLLYTKFIRNENQKSAAAPKAYRESR